MGKDVAVCDGGVLTDTGDSIGLNCESRARRASEIDSEHGTWVSGNEAISQPTTVAKRIAGRTEI